MTWVMTGDSITQAVLHTHGGRGWVEHVHERIRWQLDRLTDIVIADEDPIAWLDDPDHPNAVGHLEMANHTLRTMGLGEPQASNDLGEDH
jgi:hypothetical protein